LKLPLFDRSSDEAVVHMNDGMQPNRAAQQKVTTDSFFWDGRNSQLRKTCAIRLR
jgi:hypothetical protein